MTTLNASRSGATAMAPGARSRAPAKHGQVTSTDWTRALLRSDVIELPGFGGPLIEAKGVPWITIGPGDGGAINPNSVAARIRMRTVVMLSVSCVAAAFVLGLLLQMHLSAAAIEHRRTAVLPAWKVVGVDGEGLTISIEGTASKPIRVLVGSPLPNGERLLQTDAARRIYRTPTASVLVRDGSN